MLELTDSTPASFEAPGVERALVSGRGDEIREPDRRR